eukprot:Tbor_TRINITY_DN3807_c0_g1::TRINITY_DN3807_c0_g1_i1::g.5618::m.5618
MDQHIPRSNILLDTTNQPVLRPSKRPSAGVKVQNQKVQFSHPEHHQQPLHRRLENTHAVEDELSPPLPPTITTPDSTAVLNRMQVIFKEMQGLMSAWESLQGRNTADAQGSQAADVEALWNEMKACKRQIEGSNVVTTIQSAEPHHQFSHHPRQQLGKPQVSNMYRHPHQLHQYHEPTPMIHHEHQYEPTPHTLRVEQQKSRPSRAGSQCAPPLDRDCIVAVVEFKRQRLKRFACVEFVEPGQYVYVDGDRGQDCGFVIYCSVRYSDKSIGRTESIDNLEIDLSRIPAENGIVRDIASERDVELLHGEIATSEQEALKRCREVVSSMNLPMQVVDCEYQFDRKKISFYFESDFSVDFRKLNTQLFRIFGVRIWLENQNNKVKNVVPEGALSQSDKVGFLTAGVRLPDCRVTGYEENRDHSMQYRK